MDMIDLNLENGDVKVCPDDLIAEKDFMEAQTLIVEEDGSLGSTDDQNVNDLSTADALLDTAGEDDVDLQYQFRSNEGVTYRVVQVSGALSTDNESTLPHTIISATPSLSSPQQIQTVFTNPLNESKFRLAMQRDDRRRATHNEVERRRRDKINNWIMKLSKIVPECHSDTSKGYDVQQSKGGILAKACDYITELRESNQRLMNVLKENEQVTAELVKLKSINEALSNENDELRSVLKQNGLITRYHK
ncbi:upstream stimulatory factor 1-like isoform X3 [Planococcus citri]|uniref:upstream stimulatory factor 1-like isoform X3 n=1 Tax=Planococcus citri TaxID=170843 RepID=UPI0031F83339